MLPTVGVSMENQHYAFVESGYRRCSFLIRCLSASVLLTCGTAGWAHHSFAMYDLLKEVDVKGTVTEFRFLNPHSSVLLSVKDRSGKSSDFLIETNGSFYLARKQGWKRNSLKRGDVIVARIHPLRDGSMGGDLVKVKLSDGSELIARPQATPVPLGDKK